MTLPCWALRGTQTTTRASPSLGRELLAFSSSPLARRGSRSRRRGWSSCGAPTLVVVFRARWRVAWGPRPAGSKMPCTAPGTPYSYGPPTTVGTVSKLKIGGGEETCHSSVSARHGLAARPRAAAPRGDHVVDEDQRAQAEHERRDRDDQVPASRTARRSRRRGAASPGRRSGASGANVRLKKMNVARSAACPGARRTSGPSSSGTSSRRRRRS